MSRVACQLVFCFSTQHVGPPHLAIPVLVAVVQVQQVWRLLVYPAGPTSLAFPVVPCRSNISGFVGATAPPPAPAAPASTVPVVRPPPSRSAPAVNVVAGGRPCDCCWLVSKLCDLKVITPATLSARPRHCPSAVTSLQFGTVDRLSIVFVPDIVCLVYCFIASRSYIHTHIHTSHTYTYIHMYTNENYSF